MNSRIIFLIVVAVAFGISWYAGWLAKLAAYVDETRDELKRCTWPTWDELKGSTLVVFICMAILGIFVFAVDNVMLAIMTYLT